MESLVIFLVVGAIIASLLGMARGDDAGQFMMRLTFMEAMQVVWWYFLYGKDLM